MTLTDVLDYVIHKSDEDCADLVLRAIYEGVDINDYDNVAIRFAIYENKIITVRVLMDHVDPNYRLIVLRMAVEFENDKILRMLLRDKRYMVSLTRHFVTSYLVVFKTLKHITNLDNIEDIIKYIKLL